MVKICDMVGVREHGEGASVELWRTDDGRLVIRAYNECGNNSTDVDLWDVLDWVASGPLRGRLARQASSGDFGASRNTIDRIDPSGD